MTAENLSALYIPDEVIAEVLPGTEAPSNTTELPTTLTSPAHEATTQGESLNGK